MKKEIPMQLIVGIVILLVGAAFLTFEYFWVRLAPVHQAHVAEETLKMLPFHSDALGVDMQVAAGFYDKVESFPGGTKIYRKHWLGADPTITITSEPNPDHSTEFSPQALAIWETDGVNHNIPRYHFEPTKINDRDAVLIRQGTVKGMLLTARVISPERILTVACSTGGGDQQLYMEACDDTVHTIKLLGPPPEGKAELENVTPASPANK